MKGIIGYKISQLALIAAAFGGPAGTAWAQTGSATQTQQDAAQQSADEANADIIVTASKRAQTLLEVPVSVSVVAADAIEEAEIQDVIDLQVLVPSLQVNQIQLSSQTNFIIRGFGNGANNVGIEPSVGVFIDGVYRSRSGSSLGDFIDIERVEVLRGPQSTLFGKNASAGVVSVVTQAPGRTFEGKLEATYGNFDAVRLAGAFSGPVTDNIALGLSASYNRRDGFIRDITTGDLVNDRDRFVVRGQAVIEPGPDTRIRLIADYETANELCCAILNLVDGPTGGVIRALGGTIIAEDPFSYRTSANFSTENKNDIWGVSAQVDHDFGFANLTSITSYRQTDITTSNDVDVTSAQIFLPNVNDVSLDTFTQELRLSSNSDGPLNWMIGGFYFDEKLNNRDSLLWASQARGYINALLAPSGASLGLLETLTRRPANSFFASGQGLDENSGQDNQAYSVFGTIDFDITERLTAHVGLNYTYDSKDVFHRITSTDVYAQTDLAPLTPLIGAGAVTTLQSLQVFPKFLNFPNAVESGRSRDDKVTYSARLAYDVTDEINVYVSYATGFKGTSWNLSRDSRPIFADFPAIQQAGLLSTNLRPGTRFASPESAESLEIGVKGFFDRWQFTATYFDQSIDDFQTFLFLGTGYGLSNAERLSSRGFEFDLAVEVTDQLSLFAAGTFLDPEYTRFTASAFGDISGTRPAQIPGESLSVGGKFDFTLGEVEFSLRGDYQYRSNVAFEDDPVLQAAVGSRYTNDQDLVNLSLQASIDGGWTARIWGRNVFDDRYINTLAFPTPIQPGSYSGFVGAPQTYGITIGKQF